jgi:hypothetical protein
MPILPRRTIFANPSGTPSQHHETGPLGECFQLDFVFDRHIVAEHHGVEAQPKGLRRLGGGERPRRRDEGQIGAHQRLERHFLAARRLDRLLAGAGQRFRFPVQLFFGAVQRRLQRRFVLGLDGDENLVGAGGDVGNEQAGLAQQVEIGRRRHDAGGLHDPRQRRNTRRDFHQRDRVPIEVGNDTGACLHCIGPGASPAVMVAVNSGRHAARPHKRPNVPSEPELCPTCRAVIVANRRCLDVGRAAALGHQKSEFAHRPRRATGGGVDEIGAGDIAAIAGLAG